MNEDIESFSNFTDAVSNDRKKFPGDENKGQMEYWIEANITLIAKILTLNDNTNRNSNAFLRLARYIDAADISIQFNSIK